MNKIRSILIANRGEIASRIIRTCNRMGIRSVAVYSDSDRDAPYVRQADNALYIGESPSESSYLNIQKILQAAHIAMVDAIHPGYGFLSENAAFARECADSGFIFIGPDARAIEKMGSKANAKHIMEANGVPVIPGFRGQDQQLETLKKEAQQIGYPVLLKASEGGGGKGMRIVRNPGEMKASIKSAKREAVRAFGNDHLIVEKYIEKCRHIEFQIFGDHQGNVIHLLERECSIQRRYQKIIEESPSPVLSEAMRDKMGEAAVTAAKAIAYTNAGTVEFIYDEAGEKFYFLEVNTRLQVEHPVTEEITGLDLVEMQIEIAEGRTLALSQEEVSSHGYAIECRLYAEDPSNNFLPVTGRIEKWSVPQVEGVRVESSIRSGSEIPIFYDPLLAKLIVWGQDRHIAHRKMLYVLQRLVCLGTKTNQEFLIDLLEDDEIAKGRYDTHFVQNRMLERRLTKPSTKNGHLSAIAATLYNWNGRMSKRSLLKSIPPGWRNNPYQDQEDAYVIDGETWKVLYRKLERYFQFSINDQTFQVALIECNSEEVIFEIDGNIVRFQLVGKKEVIHLHSVQTGPLTVVAVKRFPDPERQENLGGYESPMPSQIIRVLVEKGQKIKAGSSLIVLLSMKMENTIEAKSDGIVEEIYVKEGETVDTGVPLLKLI